MAVRNANARDSGASAAGRRRQPGSGSGAAGVATGPQTMQRWNLSVPQSLRAAVMAAAAMATAREGQTVSCAEWMRRAAAEKLERDGDGAGGADGELRGVDAPRGRREAGARWRRRGRGRR